MQEWSADYDGPHDDYNERLECVNEVLAQCARPRLFAALALLPPVLWLVLSDAGIDNSPGFASTRTVGGCTLRDCAEERARIVELEGQLGILMADSLVNRLQQLRTTIEEKEDEVKSLREEVATLRERAARAEARMSMMQSGDAKLANFPSQLFSNCSLGLERFVGSPFGPQYPCASQKVLVVAPIGNDDIQLVANLMGLRRERYTLLLFYYGKGVPFEAQRVCGDRCMWVLSERQMKWWYVHRFVPDAASAYEHILILDGDTKFDFRTLDAYYEAVAAVGVPVSQPAWKDPRHWTRNPCPPMCDKRYPSKLPTGSLVNGRWANYVECGPFTSFSGKAFHCARHVILPEATIGSGLDEVWCSAISDRCGWPRNKTCAVMYQFGGRPGVTATRFELTDQINAGKQSARSLPGFQEHVEEERKAYLTAYHYSTPNYSPETFTGDVF